MVYNNYFQKKKLSNKHVYNFPYVLVIWKQITAHFPDIIKNLTRITKKHDALNLFTMGEMKTSHFPHSTEIRYKKEKRYTIPDFFWIVFCTKKIQVHDSNNYSYSPPLGTFSNWHMSRFSYVSS